MKKRGYYVYDPVIYPRLLCVAIGLNEEDTNACFEDCVGNPFEIDFNGTDALCISGIRIKSDNRKCVLVNFVNKKSMTMSVCCHEASHACDDIEEEIGMKHGDEASAYLIGWIASCINKARLGKGDFVEIKEEEA